MYLGAHLFKLGFNFKGKGQICMAFIKTEAYRARILTAVAYVYKYLSAVQVYAVFVGSVGGYGFGI